jgi:hypothetical protein
LDVTEAMLMRAAITQFTFRTPYRATTPFPGVREFESLNRPVEAAKLKVPIAEAFALVNVAKVHGRLAEGHGVG